MDRWVEIAFDCLPLRSVRPSDLPHDASPNFRAKCERILKAIQQHGTFNSYYLHNASVTYHLTNHGEMGYIKFACEGTALTDQSDAQTASMDLSVELVEETCEWLTEPVVEWFIETVRRAVAAEFDRYISVGDLQKAKDRIAQIQADSDEAGGFVGMYL